MWKMSDSSKLSEIVLQKYYAQLVGIVAQYVDDILCGLVSGTDGIINIDQKIQSNRTGRCQVTKQSIYWMNISGDRYVRELPTAF